MHTFAYTTALGYGLRSGHQAIIRRNHPTILSHPQSSLQQSLPRPNTLTRTHCIHPSVIRRKHPTTYTLLHHWGLHEPFVQTTAPRFPTYSISIVDSLAQLTNNEPQSNIMLYNQPRHRYTDISPSVAQTPSHDRQRPHLFVYVRRSRSIHTRIHPHLRFRAL